VQYERISWSTDLSRWYRIRILVWYHEMQKVRLKPHLLLASAKVLE
jgi:hypothetical protein